MKLAIGLSAILSGLLAAAAPTSDEEFRLSVSDSSKADLNDRFLIFHNSKIIISRMDGQHGMNFYGDDGTLHIENGDSVYVSSDGHVSLESGAASEGFTSDGKALKWARGSFYACLEEDLPRVGDAPPVEAIYAEGKGVPLGDNCVEVTLYKATI